MMRAVRVRKLLSAAKLDRKQAYQAKVEVQNSYDRIISALEWMGRHPGKYYNADDYNSDLVANPPKATNRRPFIRGFTSFLIASMKSKFVTIDSNATSDILRRGMPNRDIRKFRLNLVRIF